jgi:hypothetical protein
MSKDLTGMARGHETFGKHLAASACLALACHTSGSAPDGSTGTGGVLASDSSRGAPASASEPSGRAAKHEDGKSWLKSVRLAVGVTYQPLVDSDSGSPRAVHVCFGAYPHDVRGPCDSPDPHHDPDPALSRETLDSAGVLGLCLRRALTTEPGAQFENPSADFLVSPAGTVSATFRAGSLPRTGAVDRCVREAEAAMRGARPQPGRIHVEIGLSSGWLGDSR